MKTIYVHFYSKLMLFVSYFIKSKQDAEEIVSDTFYAVWEQRIRLATLQNITSAYIYSIARNITFDFIKRKTRSEDSLKIYPDSAFSIQWDSGPEDDLISEEMMKRLHAAIENLPRKTRIAFKLVREQGLKYKEAAEIMEISVKTLEAHMALATKRLTDTLNNDLL